MARQEKDPSAKPMEAEEDAAVAIVPANEPAIRDLIYTVRGMQVMLDSDLATLYKVETKVLNQAVTRNPKRFPERFCFRIMRDEAEDRGTGQFPGHVITWKGRCRVQSGVQSQSPQNHRRM